MTVELPTGEEHRYRAVRDLDLQAPEALDALLARLSDESWRVRKAAVERLAELRPVERALPHLVDALGRGDDAQARNAAAEALARIGAPAVRSLARRLADADADIRKFAADVLGEIGHADAVEPLAEALDDADRNVRAAAAEALGKIGGPRAAVALERALRNEDHLLRVSALDGLARIGAVPRTEALEPLARDRFLRRPVYRLLGRQTGDRALMLLLAGLTDPGRSTREAALAGIAEQARRSSGFFWGRLVLLARQAEGGTSALLRAAREGLGREEGAVVEGAILLVGALQDTESAARVADLSSHERFREAARLALAAMGHAAVAPLVGAAASLIPGSLELAAEIVGPVHAPALCLRALDAIDQVSPELAAELLSLLGRQGGPEVVDGLLSRMEDPLFGEQARRALEGVAQRNGAELVARARELWSLKRTPATLFLLGTVGGPPELASVRDALQEGEAAMRVAAVKILAARGVTDAADAIAATLTDEAIEVRAAAVRALGALRYSGLETVVQLALTDASPRVALAAAEIAGSWRLTALAPVLRELLLRSGGSVALASLDALERLHRIDFELLERASEHAHAEVARAAMELAAGRSGGLELMLKRLRHPRWEVRRAAARVAGRVADRSHLLELQGLLASDADPLVIEALHQAIAAIQARGS